MAALVAGQRTDSGILLEALADSSREVRRFALFAAFNQASLPGRERVVRRAWRDPDPAVRLEALRAFARHMSAIEGCAPILTALEDPDAQVRLQAIDLLAGCGAPAASRLGAIANEEPQEQIWHAPAHALVALSQVAPEQANARLPAVAGSPVWWARMYAARAAGETRNLPVLVRLARDPEPNVREAALDALDRTVGHEADSLYVAALSSGDYQLVRTAALALDSTADQSALHPLIGTLQRISRQRRETSRDTRAALLTAIGTLGGPATAQQLRPWLSDFDPAIAAQTAEILSRWTGIKVEPSARPLPRVRVPSWGALARMEATRLVFVMRDQGRVVLSLKPYDAPTNVARLVRMVREGWFTGLTFHRIAPNYVVQGGSPAANEYAGDAAFTRDELGLGSHRRGMVGISTRGRDTGDGQIFFNLVDSYRLDHEYTIVAEVIEGMEVVDRMLEGAVIERAEVVPR
jgi:cyclophilin family peptidyl-prolyl cis-trans isomerase/HEAT repeat protein